MTIQRRERTLTSHAKIRFLDIKRVSQMFDTARQRRILQTATDCQLRDMGISKFDAQIEARRRFWDID